MRCVKLASSQQRRQQLTGSAPRALRRGAYQLRDTPDGVWCSTERQLERHAIVQHTHAGLT